MAADRRRRLVVGPARSGKSSWAEQQLLDAPAVLYVATSRPDPDDPEWAERIELHRRRRPDTWVTVETTDLVPVLAESGPPVLVDCMGVWLSRVMDDADVWSGASGSREAVEARVAALVHAVKGAHRDVILVSTEVGAGLVPVDAGSRYYRDELGRLNSRVAHVVDEVWLAQVGIVRRWA